MAVTLEIRDGNPEWYLSPDIWVVDDAASDTPVPNPVAGRDYFLKARVRNTGTTPVSNAQVRFYWANPSIGVTRTTANLVGTSYVSLGANPDEQDVLCLTPWRTEFVNQGHECILAEAFHTTLDPLPAVLDFNVPTDRHVAQRNLSVVRTINGFFHFLFEIHNGERIERAFDIQATPLSLEVNRHLLPEKYTHLKEGKLKKATFSNLVCAPDLEKAKAQTSDKLKVGGFSKANRSISGQVQGDIVLLNITQSVGKTITGGLVVLIINSPLKPI
jgi:hypothetical protein